MERTYKNYKTWKNKSLQHEFTTEVPLLDADGTLLAKGWARHNVFQYDRSRVKALPHRKEWDFYQITNGKYMVQLSFANITLGGYISTMLVDLRAGKILASSASYFLGKGNKYVLPPKGDVPNNVKMSIGGADFEFDTAETVRTLFYKKGDVEVNFSMDIMSGLENITTVLPFEGKPDRYFMTTKQNCLPTEGTFKNGTDIYSFTKDDTFTVLDWGRVCTPYRLVWYWGNGSTYIYDENNVKHTFGFEITWGIGSEENATETCIFYDGKAHKFGAIDVEDFPKPDKYMQPWRFVSEDGRFDMTMNPFYDHHTDTNALILRMHSHQVHGIWNGKVTLDDGTVLEIKDMYAFCEYVENRW